MNQQPINGGPAANDAPDEFTPEQLHHIANAGFTERFMGGVREANPRGGWLWVNPKTGERRDAPLDTSKAAGVVMAVLDKHCAEQGLVWTTERAREGYGCRIGKFADPGAATADLVGAAMSPHYGISVAVALLQSIGFDFVAARAQLYDDARRIHLPN